MTIKSDIEIAQEAQPLPITDIADACGVDGAYVEQYGRYKAKIDNRFLKETDRPDGKLVLVTAITPTPAGEGKTTTTVGLGDALHKMGKKTVLALREPSLGPVFGIKGAPISTTACYAVIAVLNLCVLAAVLGKSRPRYLPLLCKPALAAALMGGCAHFVFRFLHTAAGLSPQWAVLAAIVLAASFYAFLALLLRMVTREDLALIPKGEKIAKILHIR